MVARLFQSQFPDTNLDECIPLFRVFFPDSAMAPLHDVLTSGYVGEGPRVEAFEQALQPWLERDHVLAVNSGTSALHLALHLLDLREGDEVISTPLTCVATNLSILHNGGRIVWADVDPHTGNINPDDIRRKITPRTRAIMAVHWGGCPCNLDDIRMIAEEHGIKTIEDAGHAMGARFNGEPIGCHSDFVCFSFQAVKVFTTIDGGALTCRSAADHERARLLRWYGLDRRERHLNGIDGDTSDLVEGGYKFHMNDVMATIGISQLDFLAENLAKAATNARIFGEAFRRLKTIQRPSRKLGFESSWWLYTLRVPDAKRFMSYMKRQGIETSKVHTRNDTYSVFADSVSPLPGVDEFSARSVCIPVGWWLGDKDRDRIIAAVRGFERKRPRSPASTHQSFAGP